MRDYVGHIDLYRLFGLDRRAASPALDAQLSRLEEQSSPDNASRRQQIYTARRILGDPQRRAIYDAHLADPAAAPITAETLARIAGADPGAERAAEPGGTRRSRGGRKKFIGAGIAVVAFAAVAGVITVVAGESGGDDCTDVVFIGAAGSGQRADDKIGADDGVGELVSTTYRNLAEDAEAAGKTVELRPVEYPAEPVSTLASRPGDFTGSLQSGAETATQMIDQVRSECPTSTIVVAGYSQGAMVAHRALAAQPDSDGIVGMLIADGDRLPAEPSVLHEGGAEPVKGISYTIPGRLLSGVGGETHLDAVWSGRVLSWCVPDDPVCAKGSGSIALSDVFGAYQHMAGYDPGAWRSWLARSALE